MAQNGYTPRLKELYEGDLRARLKEELGYSSVMRVPRISKVTLNMGVGEAKTEAKLLDSAVEELTTIAGQRAHLRRARKSIAGFKIREGMPIGARVTLRGDRMWEFLDRLVSIALPRPRARIVRRPGQLLARDPRADHLPGDQLRRRRDHPRPRRRHHDDRRDG
jgi:large subunit ribosomal protein L5